MITSPLTYIFTLAFSATAFALLEQKTNLKIFKYIPAVVMIYAYTMFLASVGFFDSNKEINAIYILAKTNLLPAMLFLMLLQIDLRHFLRLGKRVTFAYVAAVLSLMISFIVVSYLFAFDRDMAAAFGALAGSWMGGTANMIAVGSALGVNQEAFGFALVVDSVNYTLWVMLLLFIVPFAAAFNRFAKSEANFASVSTIGCACNMGAKRYWLLIFLALLISLVSQLLASYIEFLNSTTTVVLLATIFGVIGSFTRLKNLNGTNEVATSMLYLLVALIGSRAIFESFSELGVYVFAGFCILILHGVLMVFAAKLWKLDLFSITVASLANIGGVASAPVLAAAYDKSLVGIGVIMAIMGYLIGTFGGLIVGNILIGITQ
ncbi:MAG TPA: hypothetical protein CFH84_08270 [Sulfurimonas sp. UBA12504]|nr:MAG: hypothetical protein A2019_00195 [Sulfurimonas sp. GWF2_37_8]DAB29602.1 MAG TPA: hypothetical protein CFH84_08270 [Sulfurimonas sp. UBA12504]